MGKMKELSGQIAELKQCGEVLIGISETLTELFTGNEVEETTTPEPIKEEPATVPKEPAQEEPTPSFEDVRAILAVKSRDGYSDEIKKIISEFGVNRLSDVDPSNYAELLKKVEVI